MARDLRRAPLLMAMLLPWLTAWPAVAAALRWETQTRPGLRTAALDVPRTGQPGFTLLAEGQTGIRFTNQLADASAAENQIRQNGSGVALGDIDGDGLCDIYLCRLEGDNVLYRNLGDWKFEDITARAGVGCPGQYSTGCALVDVDGDGDLDLLVNGIGAGTRLFLNDGHGVFTESTASGLRRGTGSMSFALADVDGDGDLDLYVANYRTTTIRSTGLKILNVNGKRMVRPEDRDQYEFTPEGMLLEHGEPDVLYLNDGAGHFSAVSWTAGAFVDEDGKSLAAAPRDWSLSAMFRDIDGDGLPDMYVCSDFWSPDRVWMNRTSNGVVRFQAAPRLMLRQTSTFSMGVDFADINRDGFNDFLVLDMLSRDYPRRLRQRSGTPHPAPVAGQIEDRPQTERNTLFVNRGDGSFAELAQFAELQASDWSWGVVFVDVDLDGFEDVLITTGHDFDTQDADTEVRLAAKGPVAGASPGQSLLEFPRLNVPNCAFRNRGDLTFEECGARWGFNRVGVSHGIALADLDNDGDLDVVINNLNGAAGLYRNETPSARIAVRLKGKGGNTRGIGAELKLLGGPVAQSQQMVGAGRYLSCDEASRVFAAGKGTNFTLEVRWRSGARVLITNLQPNLVCEIDEATYPQLPKESRISFRPLPLFKEAQPFEHSHVETAFDDAKRQPLLRRRLSQLGPGVAWIDIDGDGREDLCIGSGRGGSLAIFRNRGTGQFDDALKLDGPLANAPDDLTTIVGWASGPGTTTLLVGQANYETGDTNLPAARRVEFHNGMSTRESLPNLGASPGPMALADIDGDGDLDLFVGGRVIAGRYPQPAPSRLFRNDGGEFKLAQEWPALGLVSGAIFTDLDGDGFPELVVACEWGPVRVFRNDHGKFADSALSRGLEQLTGWWNGIAAGDFDGDGRMDLVAANWGRNTAEYPYVRDSVRVYFGERTGLGAGGFLEAIQDREHGREAPWRDLETLSESMPWLRDRFATSAAFSEAGVEQILGNGFKGASELRVASLDTALFLNRGDHFEVRSLPAEAQWAPAFGICVADVNGDGREDVFLSQNFFAVDESTSRFDAGRGLWLRGDGAGNLKPLTAAESGVAVYGEQRGAALCDYDADGRVDLVVSQNGAATRCFHNENGLSGVRVRLRGPAGNVGGIGAVLRWGKGAARELHAGSGYWSQDSVVAVLARPDRVSRLSVRWPGGRSTDCEVPVAAKEIVVSADGTVERTR